MALNSCISGHMSRVESALALSESQDLAVNLLKIVGTSSLRFKTERLEDKRNFCANLLRFTILL